MTPTGRDEARREAADELLSPEYADESLLDWIYRIFQQFLGDLFDFDTSGDGSVGGILAAILIVLLLAGLVLVVVWQLRRTSRSAAQARGALFGDRAMSAAEHREEARRAAGEGRWSEAIRERLRAIARDLEERALVAALPGRTADELAAEAGVVMPAFAGELAHAARVFDDVTYGDVPGTPEAYETLSELDERVRVARPVLLRGGRA